MGKYSVGQRVRDPDGDICEVVGKPKKGVRELRLMGGNWDGAVYWADKSSLEPVTACPETSENAYSPGSEEAFKPGQFVNTTDGDTAVVESDVDDVDHVWVRHASGQRTRLPASWLTAWVPKVGERVRNIGERGYGSEFPLGSEGAVANVSDGGLHAKNAATGWEGYFFTSEVEPVVAPATTAKLEADKTYRDTNGNSVGPMLPYLDGFIEKAGDGRMWNADGSAVNEHAALVLPSILTIEAGKFYRTRDGRKVGPLVKNDWDEEHPFECSVKFEEPEAVSVAIWEPDGTNYEYRWLDLVAEWVEPAVVAVAESTATEWEPAVGEKVRCIDQCGGSKFRTGDIYTVRQVVSGLVYVDELEQAMYSFRFEPATPPAKFKVGDRVNWTEHRHCWQGITITEIKDDGYCRVLARDPELGVGAFPIDQLELAPTIPPGSTVTFTATGRLSAVNDNGHMQVTFPGLPAGRNSFALPAEYVALAN